MSRLASVPARPRPETDPASDSDPGTDSATAARTDNSTDSAAGDPQPCAAASTFPHPTSAPRSATENQINQLACQLLNSNS